MAFFLRSDSHRSGQADENVGCFSFMDPLGYTSKRDRYKKTLLLSHVRQPGTKEHLTGVRQKTLVLCHHRKKKPFFTNTNDVRKGVTCDHPRHVQPLLHRGRFSYSRCVVSGAIAAA